MSVGALGVAQFARHSLWEEVSDLIELWPVDSPRWPGPHYSLGVGRRVGDAIVRATDEAGGVVRVAAGAGPVCDDTMQESANVSSRSQGVKGSFLHSPVIRVFIILWGSAVAVAGSHRAKLSQAGERRSVCELAVPPPSLTPTHRRIIPPRLLVLLILSGLLGELVGGLSHLWVMLNNEVADVVEGRIDFALGSDGGAARTFVAAEAVPVLEAAPAEVMDAGEDGCAGGGG